MSGRLGGGVDGGEERGDEEIKQKSDMLTMTPTRWLKQRRLSTYVKRGRNAGT